MGAYQIMMIAGIPSLCAAFVTFIVHRLHVHINDNDKKTDAVRYGVQALLRAEMIAEYNRWSQKGYAPIYARESFSNMYEHYHALGGNGAMTNIYNKFMALPTPANGN